MSKLSNPYKYIKEYFLLTGCSNYNTNASRKKSRTKKKGRKVFKENNIPHAKGLVFINPLKAYKFVKKNGFPVVVKPNYGGFSKGSFFPINTYKDLIRALILVKFYWPKTVIETYLEGKNYRIVAGNKKVILVTRRYPPFVMGNGKDTILELIKKENEVRKKMKLYPVMSPLDSDKKSMKYLKNKNLKLSDIPKNKEEIRLGNKIALATGGIVENLPMDKISKKNINLFIKVLNAFDSKLLGIDAIFEKDIEIDYDKQKCIFLEVNSRSYIKMHNHPRYGTPVDIKSYMEK